MSIPEDKQVGEGMYTPEVKHVGEGMHTPEVKHNGEGISPAEVKQVGEGMSKLEVKQGGEGMHTPEVKQVGEETSKLEVKHDGEKLSDSGTRLECESDGGQADDDEGGTEPFCCDRIVSYKNIGTAHRALLDNFMNARGHAPDYTFEVIRQVDNGPILSTKYFALLNNAVEETALSVTATRIKTFKNYKCIQHNLFFSVNLYATNR